MIDTADEMARQLVDVERERDEARERVDELERELQAGEEVRRKLLADKVRLVRERYRLTREAAAIRRMAAAATPKGDHGNLVALVEYVITDRDYWRNKYGIAADERDEASKETERMVTWAKAAEADLRQLRHVILRGRVEGRSRLVETLRADLNRIADAIPDTCREHRAINGIRDIPAEVEYLAGCHGRQAEVIWANDGEILRLRRELDGLKAWRKGQIDEHAALHNRAAELEAERGRHRGEVASLEMDLQGAEWARSQACERARAAEEQVAALEQTIREINAGAVVYSLSLGMEPESTERLEDMVRRFARKHVEQLVAERDGLRARIEEPESSIAAADDDDAFQDLERDNEYLRGKVETLKAEQDASERTIRDAQTAMLFQGIPPRQAAAPLTLAQRIRVLVEEQGWLRAQLKRAQNALRDSCTPNDGPSQYWSIRVDFGEFDASFDLWTTAPRVEALGELFEALGAGLITCERLQ